jgi:hypothetical protein
MGYSLLAHSPQPDEDVKCCIRRVDDEAHTKGSQTPMKKCSKLDITSPALEAGYEVTMPELLDTLPQENKEMLEVILLKWRTLAGSLRTLKEMIAGCRDMSKKLARGTKEELEQVDFSIAKLSNLIITSFKIELPFGKDPTSTMASCNTRVMPEDGYNGARHRFTKMVDDTKTTMMCGATNLLTGMALLLALESITTSANFLEALGNWITSQQPRTLLDLNIALRTRDIPQPTRGADFWTRNLSKRPRSDSWPRLGVAARPPPWDSWLTRS